LILFFLAFSSFGQYDLTGKIVDKQTQDPLPGANIQVKENLMVTATDNYGTFVIRNLPEGTYHLTISYIGFKTLQKEVVLSKDVNIVVSMEPDVVMQDEILVTATKAGKNTPTSYTDISREQIEKQNTGKDLPYLLELTPSLVTTSDAGTGIGYTSMRIRGSDVTRINVTINGIPLNDPESQGVWWVDLPDLASSLEDIQIQRGVGTSTNGAASFGASINLQTDRLHKNSYARVSTNFGSFNTLRFSTNFGTGLVDGHWTLDGRISKILSDGYIDRSFAHLQSLYLSGGYYGKRSILRLIVMMGKERTYQAWWGVPEDSLATNRTYNYYTYENQTDNYWQDHYQAHYSLQLSRRWNLNAAWHYTWGRGYYEEFKTGQSYADYSLHNVIIGQDTFTTTDLIRQKWLDNDFIGTTYSLQYDSHKKLQVILGGAYNSYNGAHYGKVIWAKYSDLSSFPEPYYLNYGRKRDMNSFLKINWKLGSGWTLFGDMQYRRIHYRFAGFNDSLQRANQEVTLIFLNPKAGINWRVSDQSTIYASWAVGNHEPARDEYVNSTPSSRPLPETMYDSEMGYRFRGKSLGFDLNLYRMDYKNQLVLTGEINDVGEYIRTNVAKSYRQGVELSFLARLHRSLTLEGSASYSQNKLFDFNYYIDDYDQGGQKAVHIDQATISFSPSVIGSAQLEWQPFKGAAMNWTTKYVGKQYLDNTQDESKIIKPYLVNNLQLSYTIRKIKWLDELEFNVLVANILDAMYESNGYTFTYIWGGQTVTENYYYPQAGRHFLAGFRVKI